MNYEEWLPKIQEFGLQYGWLALKALLIFFIGRFVEPTALANQHLIGADHPGIVMAARYRMGFRFGEGKGCFRSARAICACSLCGQ